MHELTLRPRTPSIDSVPIAPANGIEICYEPFGSPEELIDAIVGVARRAAVPS